MTILITGSAGFIGSHLAERLLAEGHHIIGFDNFCDFYNPELKTRNLVSLAAHDSFTLVRADLRDRQAVLDTVEKYQPHIIIHLAAMAGVRPSIENPACYTAVNLDGTVNLLDAATHSKTSKFIFASSSSVYGNNTKTPFAETDPVDHPISPYAATKKAGELICHAYSHIHQLPIACLRFFTVFGPRQRPDLAINKFLHLIRENKPIPMFGDGSTSRDYTYIDDIVTGICASMHRIGENNLLYRVWNLGGSSPVSLKDMIRTIERVTGKTAQIQNHPMQPGDVNQTWADLTRSKTELNYAPTTPLEVGIEKQWQWLKELSH